jgi:hypothetical protein
MGGLCGNAHAAKHRNIAWLQHIMVAIPPDGFHRICYLSTLAWRVAAAQ